MHAPFVGEVVFLFTDIEGSTRLWQDHPRRMAAALAEHFGILRRHIEANDGHFLKDLGDGALAVFASADGAVRAAVESQRELTATSFEGPGTLRVRMGLDSGHVPPGTDRYEGPILNRTARIMDAAHGGQILASEAVRRSLDGRLTNIGFEDLGHHRLKDLREPPHLFQVVADGLEERFPPPRSLDGFAHNLPAQPSSFVGRDQALREIGERLDRARLVTLIGPGGVGKTRLAIQCAAERIEDHPGGVWLAELARVSDPELVAETVATALRLPSQPGVPAATRLVEHLRDEEALLILDNCEHVIETVAVLTERLLADAPDVTIVATSREALNVPGEELWTVPPLDEAIRLFIERATAVDPGFDASGEALTHIRHICDRLDGLPLAVELAAARTRLLSLPDIAERLDDRFKLLTGGRRTALPRQRTLEGAVAWSYDQLEPVEQVAFERLSVFVGGFTMAAAEQLLDADADADAMDVVQTLADRSLLTSDTSTTPARHDMLETIRAYGRERLLEHGRSEDTRRRHLAWSLELAHGVAAHADGPEQLTWLSLAQAELSNLRAAMEWAVDSGEPVTALRVATSLYRYWFMRGVREGRYWLERIIPVADVVDDELLGRSRYAHGGLLQVLGEYARAAEILERSVEAFRRTDNVRGLAYAIHHLARAQWGLVDPADNLDRFEEALELFREADDPVGEALSLLFTNLHAIIRGDLETAERDLRRMDELVTAIGAPQLVAHGLECRGWTAAAAGRTDEARAHYADALSTYLELRNAACAAHALEGAAQVLVLDDRTEQATELVGATEALRERIAVPPPPYENLFIDDVRELGGARLPPETHERALATGAELDLRGALERARALLTG